MVNGHNTTRHFVAPGRSASTPLAAKPVQGIVQGMSARLTPLPEIEVPPPRPDDTYAVEGPEGPIRFVGLKALLGAADFPKAGDRHAGLAAANEIGREAARSILAGLTIAHLHERPLLTADGRVDDVMRVNYDVDTDVYSEIAHLTVGNLKNRLLACSGDEAVRLGRGLTGVTAAAVAKLCDVHELILVARRIANPTKARTLLGRRGTLSSRLQPNHPTDDPRGIALLTWWGLSMAAGDALLGVNPAIDTVENVSAVLRLLDSLRRRAGAPTQICVLSHIKTQLAALDAGAPVEILFQSLAGTEATLTAEFDVTVALLDHGWRTMRDRGPLKDTAPQAMYFETGQGSEFSYGRHEGIDMTTTEALCYGLARRYDPFMINNVTGFIGPETHADNFELLLASLPDLFLGKLLGLPMGIGSCYTLHAGSGLEGQQATTELLAAAGATYFMDVALNTDRMLAYFDTSAHDNQTLREIHGREPAVLAGESSPATALTRSSADRRGAGRSCSATRWGSSRSSWRPRRRSTASRTPAPVPPTPLRGRSAGTRRSAAEPSTSPSMSIASGLFTPSARSPPRQPRTTRISLRRPSAPDRLPRPSRALGPSRSPCRSSSPTACRRQPSTTISPTSFRSSSTAWPPRGSASACRSSPATAG